MRGSVLQEDHVVIYTILDKVTQERNFIYEFTSSTTCHFTTCETAVPIQLKTITPNVMHNYHNNLPHGTITSVDAWSCNYALLFIFYYRNIKRSSAETQTRVLFLVSYNEAQWPTNESQSH